MIIKTINGLKVMNYDKLFFLKDFVESKVITQVKRLTRFVKLISWIKIIFSVVYFKLWSLMVNKTFSVLIQNVSL